MFAAAAAAAAAVVVCARFAWGSPSPACVDDGTPEPVVAAVAGAVDAAVVADVAVTPGVTVRGGCCA